ncbi:MULTISPECIES: TolC family protein [Halomonadaceae]
MREALATHPSIGMQVAVLEASEHGYQRSRWAYFPTPIISSSTAWRQSSSGAAGGVSGEKISLGLSQPLWTGGRLTAGRELASAGLGEASARLEEVSLDLMQSVLSGVGQWRAAYLRRQAWRQNVRVHDELRAQMDRRLASGVASRSDLALAVSRYEGVAAELSQFDAEVAAARAALEQLLGRELSDQELLSIPEEPFPWVDGEGVDVLLRQALEGHPAMLAAEAEVERRRAEYGQVRAERYPNIRLEVRHREFHRGPAEQVAELVVESEFGPGLSVVSAAQQAVANVDAARAGLDEQQRRVAEMITQDYVTLEALDSQIEPVRRSVVEAENVFASYRRQYLAGQKTWLDVLNSAGEVASTKVRLTDAITTRMVLSWRLALNTYGIDSVLGVDLGGG